MQILPLGVASGGPFQGRHYTAQLIKAGPHTFLVDCGEGTQLQLYHYRAKYDGLKQIFITHLHGDHVFGLLGLITNWCLKKRTAPLQIFSPPGLQTWVETSVQQCAVRLCYPIEFVEVDASVSEKVFENRTLEVWTIPLRHRIPCTGWLFREKTKQRNILKHQIEAYNIPFQQIPALKAGGDLLLPDGRLIPNAELTTPPAPPLSYAFCSDTMPSEAVVAAVKGVDLLYHEATFSDEHAEEAVFSFHSTARQAAEVARQAGVKRLLLGHFSGRYTSLERHLEEARSVFAETELAEEGKWIEDLRF